MSIQLDDTMSAEGASEEGAFTGSMFAAGKEDEEVGDADDEEADEQAEDSDEKVVQNQSDSSSSEDGNYSETELGRLEAQANVFHAVLVNLLRDLNIFRQSIEKYRKRHDN